ncbi:hypothetical protein OROMI_008943 [Orobanche minor]
MASNQKPKPSTKTPLADKIRRAICEHKKEHPTLTQKDMQAWVKEKFE